MGQRATYGAEDHLWGHLWGRGSLMVPLMGQRVSYGSTYGAEGHFWGHLWGRGSLLVPLMGQRITSGATYGAEGDLWGHLWGRGVTYGAEGHLWGRPWRVAAQPFGSICGEAMGAELGVGGDSGPRLLRRRPYNPKTAPIHPKMTPKGKKGPQIHPK